MNVEAEIERIRTELEELKQRSAPRRKRGWRSRALTAAACGAGLAAIVLRGDAFRLAAFAAMIALAVLGSYLDGREEQRRLQPDLDRIEVLLEELRRLGG